MRVRVPLGSVLPHLAGVGALLACAAASAADLAEVYRSSLANDPVLGAARADYDATAEIVPQARSGLLPNLTTSVSTADNLRVFPDSGADSQTFNDHGWQAQLRQPVFDAEAWFTYRSALATRAQAEHTLTASEQELIVRVAQAYLDVLRAQALLETTRSQETAFKRQLEQVQQRFDVGLVAITDVLEATAGFDLTVVDRVQAEGDHDIFFETLTTLTGVDYEEIQRFSPTLPIVLPEPADEEVWVATALANNPEVKAAQEQQLAAQREVRARRSEHLPTVDAVATYNYFQTGGAAFLGGQTETRAYELQLALPIYQGGFTQARVREAESRQEQASELLRGRQLVVERDTRNLFRAVATDVVRVEARLKAIRSTESALEAVRTGYEVGTRNIVDVLEAEQRVYASQFDYADSRYNYVLDVLRLKQRAGVLSERDLLELNQFVIDTEPVRTLRGAPAVPGA